MMQRKWSSRALFLSGMGIRRCLGIERHTVCGSTWWTLWLDNVLFCPTGTTKLMQHKRVLVTWTFDSHSPSPSPSPSSSSSSSSSSSAAAASASRRSEPIWNREQCVHHQTTGLAQIILLPSDWMLTMWVCVISWDHGTPTAKNRTNRDGFGFRFPGLPSFWLDNPTSSHKTNRYNNDYYYPTSWCFEFRCDGISFLDFPNYQATVSWRYTNHWPILTPYIANLILQTLDSCLLVSPIKHYRK